MNNLKGIINKRAELSTQQIVLMIILIASFAVILFFLLRLNIGEKSEEQLCRNSVLQKASVFSEAPLQCYRNYICITEDGSCEELIKPEKVKVNSLEEVYKTLANEMADCWWMFGEGKVEYVGKDFTKNNYCSICSQIYFDDSLEAIDGVENKKISKDELYEYMIKNEYSKNKTYSQYLLGTNDLSIFKEQGIFGNIEIGKQYFNVMGITSGTKNPWASSFVAGSVGYTFVGLIGTFFGPPGWIASAIIIGGSTATTAGALTISDLIEPEIGAIVVQGNGIDNQFMSPTLQEADSDKFKALNCEEILTYT